MATRNINKKLRLWLFLFAFLFLAHSSSTYVLTELEARQQLITAYTSLIQTLLLQLDSLQAQMYKLQAQQTAQSIPTINPNPQLTVKEQIKPTVPIPTPPPPIFLPTHQSAPESYKQDATCTEKGGVRRPARVNSRYIICDLNLKRSCEISPDTWYCTYAK